MPDVMTWMREYQSLLEWLAGLSLLMFAVTLVVFPLVIIFLPEDYFVRDQRDPARETRRHPAVWLTLTILKNILGLVLVLAGIAMLVLPGQGLLTVLLGVTLVNFPGKYALERRIVSRPSVARALNRIREAAGRNRLKLPDLDDL
ncbi:MAG: PGPGW domain-containing protein [Acidobacteriota bacterium]|nr:PGPGW domain-containing protein [Acidobacteriota bacterium]